MTLTPALARPPRISRNGTYTRACRASSVIRMGPTAHPRIFLCRRLAPPSGVVLVVRISVKLFRSFVLVVMSCPPSLKGTIVASANYFSAYCRSCIRHPLCRLPFFMRLPCPNPLPPHPSLSVFSPSSFPYPIIPSYHGNSAVRTIDEARLHHVFHAWSHILAR